MDAKTLAESYEGCLSRDWEKLLDALDRGEKRIIIYTRDFKHSEKGLLKIPHCDVAMAHFLNGNVMSYDIGALFPAEDMDFTIAWVSDTVVGFFPTKEDIA